MHSVTSKKIGWKNIFFHPILLGEIIQWMFCIINNVDVDMQPNVSISKVGESFQLGCQ